MKVQAKTEEVKFQPITVNLTFETEEEFRVFKDMIGRDKTIPEFMYSEEGGVVGYQLRTKLESVMSDIFWALNKIKF